MKLKYLFIGIATLFIMTGMAMATEYQWSGGVPVQTDNTNYEWSGGVPYIIMEVTEAPVEGVEVTRHLTHISTYATLGKQLINARLIR